MWTRHHEQPITYKGIRFRSSLEGKVAEQLDALGVQWGYEVPPHEGFRLVQPAFAPPRKQIGWYLPDFTILEADPAFALPLWVEVKPAEALAAVRDFCQISERFDGTREVELSAQQLHQAAFAELWKPKRCAEFYQESVLMVYAINRNRTLSLLMTPTGIEFSHVHPTVNYRQVVREEERRIEQECREQEWEAQRQERAAAERQRRADLVAYVRTHGRPAKYDGWCLACGNRQRAQHLVIFRTQEARWGAVCRVHLTEEEYAYAGD